MDLKIYIFKNMAFNKHIWKGRCFKQCKIFHLEVVRRTEIKVRGIYPEDKETIHFIIFVLVNACAYFFVLKFVNLHEETDLLLSNDRNAKRSKEIRFRWELKSEKNNDNHFSNCSLKILNLHKKSKYH